MFSNIHSTLGTNSTSAQISQNDACVIFCQTSPTHSKPTRPCNKIDPYNEHNQYDRRQKQSNGKKTF